MIILFINFSNALVSINSKLFYKNSYSSICFDWLLLPNRYQKLPKRNKNKLRFSKFFKNAKRYTINEHAKWNLANCFRIIFNFSRSFLYEEAFDQDTYLLIEVAWWKIVNNEKAMCKVLLCMLFQNWFRFLKLIVISKLIVIWKLILMCKINSDGYKYDHLL